MSVGRLPFGPTICKTPALAKVSSFRPQDAFAEYYKLNDVPTLTEVGSMAAEALLSSPEW